MFFFVQSSFDFFLFLPITLNRLNLKLCLHQHTKGLIARENGVNLNSRLALVRLGCAAIAPLAPLDLSWWSYPFRPKLAAGSLCNHLLPFAYFLTVMCLGVLSQLWPTTTHKVSPLIDVCLSVYMLPVTALIYAAADVSNGRAHKCNVPN